MMKSIPCAMAGALLLSLAPGHATPTSDSVPLPPQAAGAEVVPKRLTPEERAQLRRQLADFHKASRAP